VALSTVIGTDREVLVVFLLGTGGSEVVGEYVNVTLVHAF